MGSSRTRIVPGLGPRFRGARPGRSEDPAPRSSSICRATYNDAPSANTASASALAAPAVDIATLATAIAGARRSARIRTWWRPLSPRSRRDGLRALSYRTAAPAGKGPLYRRIGLFAFTTAPALERLVKIPRRRFEQREQLEQLRALEDVMRMDVSDRRRAARRRHTRGFRSRPRHADESFMTKQKAKRPNCSAQDRLPRRACAFSHIACNRPIRITSRCLARRSRTPSLRCAAAAPRWR